MMETTISLDTPTNRTQLSSNLIKVALLALTVGGLAGWLYPYSLIIIPLIIISLGIKQVIKYVRYSLSIDLTPNKYSITLDDINDTGF